MLRAAGIGLASGLVLLVSACGGGGGAEFPPEPTVIDVSFDGSTLVSGGVGTFTATVQSASRAERVIVDFYLVTPSGSCAGTGQPVASSVPFDLAYNLLEGPASRRQARFFATGISYTPDTGLREARLTQTFQSPILALGTYAVVGAVRGKEPECRKSAATISVVQATQPELVHTFTKATRNSFRIPPAAKLAGRGRAAPVLSVSSEIANVGLVWNGDVEVGFLLEIDGVDYPLEVELTDAIGNTTRAHRHTYGRKVRQGQPQPMMQGDVRGATHHLHLGVAAEEKLRATVADKTCTLKIVLDPEQKIPGVARSAQAAEESGSASAPAGVASLPVQFLAGQAPCPVGAGLTEVQYCFGPGGYGQGASDNGDVAGSYQFADTEANPSYLASGPRSASGMPSVVRSYSKTDSSFGQSGATSSLLRTEVTWNITPPQPGTTAPAGAGPGALVGASSAGNVGGSEEVNVFSTMVISRNFQDFSEDAGVQWYKKEAKKVLFEKTWIVGEVPVKVEIGVKGELGLQGKVHVELDVDKGFTSLGYDIGPYLGVVVYAEASVNFVVCQVGVGFDLTIFRFSVGFQLYARTVIGSQPGTSGMELSSSLPLTMNALSGDIYVFVKLLGLHTWKYSIVSWEGWTWVVDIMPPVNMYFGSPGSFMVDGIHDGSPITPTVVHGVIDGFGGPVYGTDKLHWIGDIRLSASTYRFSWTHVGSVLLSGNGLNRTLVSSCSGGGTSDVAIPQAGDYTLEVSTDASCWRTGSPTVTWTELGASGVGSGSGYAGTPSGNPACAVSQAYYDTDVFSGTPVPVDVGCVGDVNIRIPWDKRPSAWIPSPDDGLWVQWSGTLPAFDAAVDKVLVWFQGNPDAPADCFSQNVPYWNGGDLLELVVEDAEGKVVFTNATPNHQPLSFGRGSTGNAFVEIPLDGAAPFAYSLRYHPINHADCGDRPGADPRDAALKMTVVPLGRWLVETTCQLADGSAPFTVPAATLDGPTDPTVGTLSGGSVSATRRCANAAPDPRELIFFVQERVVGGFDFRSLPTAGQAFDFFAGAYADHGYKLWIDAVLMSARDTSTAVGLYHVREAHVPTVLSQGYHVVEGWFTAGPPPTDLPGTDALARSDDRIRWSTQGNGNRSLGFLYASAAEVDAVLAGDATGGAPQPLMIVDFPTPVPPSIDWSDLSSHTAFGACDAFVNGQLSCADSLRGVANPPSWYSFSSLWEGTYALSDQVPYLYSLTSNCDSVDLWLDNASYSSFQTGLANPVPYHPFPTGSPASFFGVLMNKQSPANRGLNSIRVAVRCRDVVPVTAELDSNWTAAAPGTYLVVFLGADGRPVPGTTATGNHGTGPTQILCVGAGCSAVPAIPAAASTILLLASPVADPLGTYQTSSTGGSVDMLLDTSGTPGASFDVCVNGWCGTGYSPGGRVASPSFLPYSTGSDGTGASGITSQQASTLLLRIPRPSGGWPAGASFRFQLGYQAHAW